MKPIETFNSIGVHKPLEKNVIPIQEISAVLDSKVEIAVCPVRATVFQWWV